LPTPAQVTPARLPNAQAVDRAQEWAAALGLTHSVRFVLANATVSMLPLLRSYPGPISLITIQFPDPQFKRRHRKRRIVQPELVEAAAKLLTPGGHILLQSDVLEVAEDMRDHFAVQQAFRPAGQHAAEGAVFHAESVRPPPDTSAHAAVQACSGDNSSSGGEDEEQVQGLGRRLSSAGWLRSNPLVRYLFLVWDGGASLPGGPSAHASTHQQYNPPQPVPTEREVLTLKQQGEVYRIYLEKQ
jgi:Putative methyltransferase